MSENTYNPERRIAAIRSYSLKPSENMLNEETVFLLGQLDIRDVEIAQAVNRIQEILKIAAPQIEPFGGLTNLCLQIDNLVAGQMREIDRLKAALRTVAARIDDTVAVGWLGDYRGTLAAFLREAVGDPS